MGKLVFLKFLDLLWGLLSFIPALLAVGGCLSSWLHPAAYVELQWLGLLLPLILLLNALLLIYWLRRKSFWLLIPLGALLINIPYITTAFHWPFKKIKPANRGITVASYNIHDGDGGNYYLEGCGMFRFVQDEKVDILCLQEFPFEKEKQLDLIDSLKIMLPYYAIHNSSASELHTALFSRYPILEYHPVIFQKATDNTALWADLDVEGERVRVFNKHLQTTNLNQHRITPPQNIGAKLRAVNHLRRVMEENMVQRAEQADVISSLIEKSPYPVIVCGDFNDTPASYVYRKIKGDLIDSFTACGKGYGYSYRYLKKLYRIDYIFYSRNEFRAARYYSPNLEYSDHKPVIVTLDFTPGYQSGEEQIRK